MIRTQVQLTDDQARALKALSARTGLSIAELIRRGLAPLLRDETASNDDRFRRAAAVAGRYHSGQTSISTEHDRYLAEA
jgi:ribbon-helix-helix protein